MPDPIQRIPGIVLRAHREMAEEEFRTRLYRATVWPETVTRQEKRATHRRGMKLSRATEKRRLMTTRTKGGSAALIWPPRKS